ncbi:MAG: hypothetical protein H6709_16175 [Kofleriaceae bacterium]|nr:hypothetical protein [Myxococcales bacterium]MCB9563200.1 hypothetical protein [Kofleriaceae bacterium]MCB9573617.1 hypothetical protein [Kofleriaceae bacterium]
MRPTHYLAALAMVLGSAACVGTLDPMPGDDDGVVDPPDPTSQARQMFDDQVAPMLSSACAGCHAGAIDTTPLKYLGNSGMTGYYAAIIAEPSVTGGFDPGLANMVNKGEHDGGNARAWTQTEKDILIEWLLQEADERGVVPVDPVDPTTTPTTSREALAQWSACMSVDDWLSSQVYTWANKGSERGQCMSCHNQGAGGYYASNDPNEMYSMNRYELFITTFFTATPVNVADPSQGYKIVVNESKLRAKANATGHPSYNPDGNQMNYLHDFYDLTEARRLAGTCAPGGFPEPPAQ